MARVLLGLDLGASKIAAVVAVHEGDGALKVTGAGLASPQGGINQGEITNIQSAVNGIYKAVEDAMRTAGQSRLDGILVAVDGIQFKCENLRESITIPNRVIKHQDINRVMEQATSACKLAKEETLLHTIPQLFHIKGQGNKGQRNIENPVNMLADTLEAEMRIIVAPPSVLENINRALELSGLRGVKLWYSPLTSAEAVLSREDMKNGAVIVDIGDHLTHLGVFMHGALFYSAVIPIGGSHFTSDIERTKHLGGLLVAEQVKRRNGTVLPSQVPPEVMIELEAEGKQVSNREIAEVLHYRAVELIDFVHAEIGRSGIEEILGGVHLVGGGAVLLHLPVLAQKILGKPRVVLGRVSGLQCLPEVMAHPLYTNALGAVKVLHNELDSWDWQDSRGWGWFRRLTKWFYNED